MSTQVPALTQLRLSSSPLEFHRNKDLSVKLIDPKDGQCYATFAKTDWEDIGDFFTEIAHPDSLL